MQQARAAPGSASRRTHHAQKRGSLSKGCVSRAAHQTPLTSRKRPVNPGGNHIRANMVHASLVAGPLIIHVGRLPGERATPNPRRRWAEKALHPTHPRWGRLSTAELHRRRPWNTRGLSPPSRRRRPAVERALADIHVVLSRCCADCDGAALFRLARGAAARCALPLRLRGGCRRARAQRS